jgi:lipoprotein-anchoring transpeptidase ErfK/SrfK
MKTTSKAAKRATWILMAVLSMTAVSSGLQSAPSSAVVDSVFAKASKLAEATVHFVLVSIPDRKLALFENGKVVRIYRVAVGKASTPSPTGSFRIVNRVTNPSYYHKGQVIAAGKDNPVGTRWMGLSAKGYGIHGTNQPSSIGKAASTGCIRMGQRDLEGLFELLNTGDTVEIRAERDEQVAQTFGTEDGLQTIAEVTAKTEEGGGH